MARDDQASQRKQRYGKLRIPMPFEEAVKAGLETPPPPETKRTGDGRKRPKKQAKR